ncbi:MAG TPA: DUF2235 domain-containing protein [Planctomycetota bacterium]|nr:DUF2235 domain-containing protein [Planctomycetota bacterium]
MAKNIALCFDGTWNTPESDDDGVRSPTNVWKLHERIREIPGAQTRWYDAGVGTEWYNRLRGGILGYGLSKNVKQGYARLAREYADGDRIFIFGFSRGAYTARSLAGLVRKCWIPRVVDERVIDQAYAFYRRRDDGPDAPDVDAFRRAHGRAAEVHCVGVFDTVGALGIPGGFFKALDERFWAFHDTALSRIVRNAFHAVAIDENRPQYLATLWDDKPVPGQTVEQRWFTGAHSNVGGGYADTRLADLALEWMVERARGCGLDIAPRAQPMPADAYAGVLRDSYKEFLGWIYRLVSKRLWREIPLQRYRNTLMTIADEAYRRRADPSLRYAPPNLPPR